MDIMRIELTSEYKAKAAEVIRGTISKVANRFNYELDEQDVLKIRNLSLDQININVTMKTKSKTLWVFDAEDVIPIAVDNIDRLPKMGLIGQQTNKHGAYLMRPNLSWTFGEENIDKGGLSEEEFKEEVLKMLLEDFETAAFYGALSYITGDGNDR